MKRHICDRCNKESEVQTNQDHKYPEGWRLIGTKQGVYSQTYVNYLLCKECADHLKLVNENDKEYHKDVSDRLLEIIESIVEEAVTRSQEV